MTTGTKTQIDLRVRILAAAMATVLMVALLVVATVQPAQRAQAADNPTAVDDTFRFAPGHTGYQVGPPGLCANDRAVPNPPHLLIVRTSANSGNRGTDGGYFTVGRNFCFLRYTPPPLDPALAGQEGDPDYQGTDQIGYCYTSDANRGLGSASDCISNMATITMIISTDPAPPVATDDHFKTNLDTTLNVQPPGLFVNDQGITAGDEVRVTQPGSGSVSPSGGGGFVYEPRVGFIGLDYFKYCVVRKGGCAAPDAGVYVAVVDPTVPMAVDDVYSTPKDTALGVRAPGVLTNDKNVRGGRGDHLKSPTSHGRLVAGGGLGDFKYTPDPGFVGTDSFTYCIRTELDYNCLSNVATVTIRVTAFDYRGPGPGNQPPPRPVTDPSGAPPMAVDDSINTSAAIPVTFDLATNDKNVGRAIALEQTKTTHGTLTDIGNTSVRYVPAPGFRGVDGFTYCLFVPPENGVAITGCDSNVATVRITVTAVVPPAITPQRPVPPDVLHPLPPPSVTPQLPNPDPAVLDPHSSRGGITAPLAVGAGHVGATAPSPHRPSSGVAFTGANIAPLTALALLVTVLGAWLVVVSRRPTTVAWWR